MKNKSEIRFGTCSWKYESWKGLVYPESKEFNFLSEYARHYNSVEVDQWFWSLFPPSKVVLPQKKVVQEYSISTPDDFQFTIKVPNSLTLTHFYKKSKDEPIVKNPFFLSTELFSEFLETLQPLKNKIGCLIFQFEYLNKEKMSSQREFLNKFRNFIENTGAETYLIGLEIRNPNYLNKSLFESLQIFNIAPVLLEGYYMPSVVDTYKKFSDYFNKKVVFRLHGPDRKGIDKIANDNWNKIYIDRIDEIRKLSEMFRELLSRNVDLFINVNNHFEGSAPITIKRIKEQIGIK